MIFTQPAFLAFFAVCFGVRWGLRGHRAQKLWLLSCSYFFYACWDWRFVGLILASTLVDYVAGAQLGRLRGATVRRLVVGLSLAVNLGILGFFKYYDFFVTAGADALGTLGVSAAAPVLNLVLPVGISFFTFQTMSYTVDVYRGEVEPTADVLDFAMFVSFFPQLVAGPIVRARHFLPQLNHQTSLADVDGRGMLLMFLGGFFKKACIADNIAASIDPVFASPEAYGGLDVVLASVMYTVQIYCDFSGYTDMAIAVAGMLGYQLTKNFDFPLLSPNVREFWRRWHISLSTWLRDYLYVSLGGGRGSRLRVFRSLMLTMVLGGLWHGANMTFVVWGALHGLALVVHRLWAGGWGRLAPRGLAYSALCTSVTFGWVVVCFVLFRSPSLDVAAELLSACLRPAGAASIHGGWWVLLGALALAHWGLQRHGRDLGRGLSRLPESPFYVGYGMACALVPFFMPFSAAPFVYFQF